MGLFGKKKKATIVPTLTVNLIKVIKEHDKEVENYQRMKINIQKFVTKFKHDLGVDASINGDKLTLYLRKEYYDSYPDQFFAMADKLGLTVEPYCTSGYSSDERSFIIRVKNKWEIRKYLFQTTRIIL